MFCFYPGEMYTYVLIDYVIHVLCKIIFRSLVLYSIKNDQKLYKIKRELNSIFRSLIEWMYSTMLMERASVLLINAYP